MTTEKKVGMGIAGQPTGGAVDVADVFSTYLYTGTGAAQTITNGIDLAGEGGMVWTKKRNAVRDNSLFDSERANNSVIKTNTSGAASTKGYNITMNSNGYSWSGSSNDVNFVNETFASWTFRKAPKFFDVVTWTGNGAAGREIAHGLDGPVGMMIIKNVDIASGWIVWSKSMNSEQYLRLNESSDIVSSQPDMWDSTLPTNTNITLGYNAQCNQSGSAHVAYLFADNTAEDADEQMIKCGSYTGNGVIDGPEINLGWEPQYVMVKSTGASQNWHIMDSMRGIVSGGNTSYLYADTSGIEAYDPKIELTPTGFHVITTSGSLNTGGLDYIYMAIRAPMMVEPESGTEVFHVANREVGPPSFNSGFVTDMMLYTDAVGGGNNDVVSRMTGKVYLQANTTAAEVASANFTWDYNDGCRDASSVSANYFAWMFKRAKGFFDVVAYTGTGVAGQTINHSLGVVPEMAITKCRSFAGTNWNVWTEATGLATFPSINQSGVSIDTDYGLSMQSSTDAYIKPYSTFSTNGSGQTYIAYLFATLAGISKVGSYTGNGSSQTINCGFAAGARFILIKRKDAAGGDWYIWDNVRGIVAGNDPHLSLNSSAAQVTNDDSIDPDNSGFSVNQISATNINVSSASYIYLAIA